MKPSRKPYSERSDLEKLKSQWRKLSGLDSREEWSAAVVRAATAAEIAANIAVRKEFQNLGSFAPDFVDSLLQWANGLIGKLDKLLIPITRNTNHATEISNLRVAANSTNKIRNAVVHRGEFCNEKEAKDAISQSRTFVEGILKIYEPSFKLKEPKL